MPEKFTFLFAMQTLLELTNWLCVLNMYDFSAVWALKYNDLLILGCSKVKVQMSGSFSGLRSKCFEAGGLSGAYRPFHNPSPCVCEGFPLTFISSCIPTCFLPTSFLFSSTPQTHLPSHTLLAGRMPLFFKRVCFCFQFGV